MSEPCFIAFIVDRFDMRSPTIAVLADESGPKASDLAGIACLTKLVVTHDAALLIEMLRGQGLNLPETVVDIEEALRQVSQISKDQGGVRHWNVWRSGVKHFEKPGDGKAIEGLLTARDLLPAGEELQRLSFAAVRMIKDLWASTEAALKERGEWERFSTKEIPVQQIFHHRQLNGLSINEDLVAKYIRESENEKFSYFRKISSQLGFSPMGLTLGKLIEKLSFIGADLPSEDVRTDVLEDWLELAEFSSQAASDVLAYRNSSKDVSVLRRINCKSGRIYPSFRVHGTVTSRVLVIEPGLQQLRKRFRSIIQADQGMELAYFDYAQFEPAILACLAGENDLSRAYQSSDLYLSLASEIFGETGSRDVAKKIFLSYCYGMSKHRIAHLLAGAKASPSELQKYEEAVASFFRRFPKVDEFRDQSRAVLLRDGLVGTLFGNFRRRTSSGSLTRKEERWAMNHMVQGTASLIFKDALLRLKERFGANSILLPMHDAVLMQFSSGEISRDDFERNVLELMAEAFQSYFPSVKPKVLSTSFAA